MERMAGPPRRISTKGRQGMNLRAYYQKIRDAEKAIPAEFAVVVSLETPDGGREGVMTEVTRSQAAKLMVEGRARLASRTEGEKHRKEISEIRKAEEERQAAKKVQIALVSDNDLRLIRSGTKEPKN
jgi:hypothetical protein